MVTIEWWHGIALAFQPRHELTRYLDTNPAQQPNQRGKTVSEFIVTWAIAVRYMLQTKL
jgi:hypothetical protein